MTSTLAEQLQERRLERMRLGQKSFEIVSLVSDPEFRVGLVPLLESEYDECMRSVALLDVPENVGGASVRDRHERREVLARAIRDPEHPDIKIFNSVRDMAALLEIADINFLYERYVEMTAVFSPHIGQLTEEDIDFLKELWQKLQWKDLSGRQLYALSRFISTLSQRQLTDNLPGFFSTIL